LPHLQNVTGSKTKDDIHHGRQKSKMAALERVVDILQELSRVVTDKRQMATNRRRRSISDTYRHWTYDYTDDDDNHACVCLSICLYFPRKPAHLLHAWFGH